MSEANEVNGAPAEKAIRGDETHFTPRPSTEEERRRWKAAYPVHYEQQGDCGLARFGPHGFFLPADAGPFLRDYYSTPVHADDVWVVTLPKCGTTWMQEMVWLLLNDCDYASAQSLLCPDRYQFLELNAICAQHIREEVRQGENDISKRNMFLDIRQRPRPWFVKTHMPLHFCPPNLLEQGKVIYVTRNPKDMCVSYLSHYKLFEECAADMTLDRFAELFMAGEVSQLPYFPHVLEAWRQRHHPNLLFVFFEEMKRDLRASIVKVADFLGKKLSTEQLDGLQHNLSFETMKNNPWVNKSAAVAYLPASPDKLLNAEGEAVEHPSFMRKGEAGDWKRHFSPEMAAKFDRWIEQELAGTDFKMFPAK